ncbi:Uncharacterised protein [Escherichia coli]|jgi:hypothetical protein|nr:Uncharacterised protein [Escherichia coli]STL99061.1 Uncharacterised protein [Escherichia coli]
MNAKNIPDTQIILLCNIFSLTLCLPNMRSALHYVGIFLRGGNERL